MEEDFKKMLLISVIVIVITLLSAFNVIGVFYEDFEDCNQTVVDLSSYTIDGSPLYYVASVENIHPRMGYSSASIGGSVTIESGRDTGYSGSNYSIYIHGEDTSVGTSSYTLAGYDITFSDFITINSSFYLSFYAKGLSVNPTGAFSSSNVRFYNGTTQVGITVSVLDNLAQSECNLFLSNDNTWYFKSLNGSNLNASDSDCNNLNGTKFNRIRFDVQRSGGISLPRYVKAWFDNIYMEGTPFNVSEIQQNDMPVITDAFFSDLSPDLFQDVGVSITAYDSENDTLCWQHTCDYASEYYQSGRQVEEYFNANETADYLRQRMNAYDPFNCSYNTYQEDVLVGYVWNITTGCTIPSEFWLNTTNNSVGVDYDDMTSHFLAGFNEDNMILHAGLKTAWSVPSSPLSTMLTDAYYLIGYARQGSTDYVYRSDDGGVFHLLHSSGNVADRILIDMDWNLQKYRVRIDDSFDGDYDYNSSWYDFLNSGGKLKTLYYVSGATNISDGYAYENITLTSHNIPLLDENPAYIDTIYLDYINEANVTFNCSNINPYNFTCNYDSLGTKTIKAWVTDDIHPNNITQYVNQDVVVSEQAGETCEGYSEQICTGTCFFTDDFNYDFPLYCAGWQGMLIFDHPISNVCSITNLSIYESNLYVDRGSVNAITSSQWYSFNTLFDLKVKSSDTITFSVANKDLTKTVLYLMINNYVMTAYKSTGSITLATLTPDTWYDFEAFVNYQTNTVYYYLNDTLVGSIGLYDDDVTSARRWGFTWVTQTTQFDIDNFDIKYVEENPSGTNVTEEEVTEYVYNPDLFCAINWTTNNTMDRFSEQNCVERGFSTVYPLLSLCIPRACIQDMGLMTFSWATSNIFRTIIIVTAFILIAPLIVVLLKRR